MPEELSQFADAFEHRRHQDAAHSFPCRCRASHFGSDPKDYAEQVFPHLPLPIWILKIHTTQSPIRRPPTTILHHPRRLRHKQQQRRRRQFGHRLELLPQTTHPRRQRLAQRRQQPIRHSAPNLRQQARRRLPEMALLLPHHAGPQQELQRL